MRSLPSCVLVVSVLAWSCGGGGSRPDTLSSRWTAPSILSHVPADTPYLIAELEPVSESLRRRMMQGADEQIAEAIRKLDTVPGTERQTLEPWMRAAIAVMDELRGKEPATWLEHLGFDPRGRFAAYGLGVWPVVRIELAAPARLRQVIERALAAAQIKPQQGTRDGRTYWIAAGAKVSFVAAVLEREAVAAIVPSGAIAAALPLVLGTRAPERSLAATTTVPDLLARHRFAGVLLGYVDSRNLIASAASGRPPGLDASLRSGAGELPPACRAELDRLAAAMPRLVLGYHRLDDAGFVGSAVFETTPATVAALRKLHTAVPGVTAPLAGHPLFAFGAAIDPRGLIEWLQGLAHQLRDQPFACRELRELNDAGRELADVVDKPLPPAWLGVRGFSAVLDNVTLSLPEFSGHVLVAGERVADLVTSLAGMVPAIAGIPLAHDGRPIALPTRQLHVPVRAAHLALTTDRLVIAAGEDSARRATERLASPVPRSSPLAMVAIDVPRLQKILQEAGEKDVDGFSHLGNFGMSLDIVDAGVAFDFWGTWQPDAPAPASKAPRR